MSPGTYVVTIAARGTRASTEVEVNGDPLMPISVAEYLARERFLLGALALVQEIQDFMSAQGMAAGRGGRGFGRGGGPAMDTPEGRLLWAARAAQQAYGSVTGSQVRPGSLYPPTHDQQAALAEARRTFEEVRAQLMGR